MTFVTAFAVLSAVCAVLSWALIDRGAAAAPGAASAGFSAFQSRYLTVFLVMNAGDWLQGPYVYALYQSYGYDTDAIALLFVVGFLSSAIFGTVIGAVADTMGRKRLAVLYAVLYGVSCVTKLSPVFAVLLFGRVVAGVATSLLFSVFESWMVCEHNRLGFPADLVSQTFSWATWGNGLVAILSGVAANVVVDAFGLVAPFGLALLFFVAGAVMVTLTWSENFGQEKSSQWLASLYTGVAACRQDFKILSLGAIQSLFESAMYCFVFVWTPTLQRGMSEAEALALPFGYIFAAFMVSVMIGSLLFGGMVGRRVTAESIARWVYFLAAAALVVPVIPTDPLLVFGSFVLFEVCCGMHFPLIGTLRSKYIPEDSRSAVLNLVRVPLNLIVVVVLLKVGSMQLASVYLICSCLLAAAGYFAYNLPVAAVYISAAGDLPQ